MTTTLVRLSAILVKDYMIPPESLKLDAPLEALGIDSLGMAELLFHLEDEFKISLTQESVTLQTVGDVVSYIDTLLTPPNSGADHVNDVVTNT